MKIKIKIKKSIPELIALVIIFFWLTRWIIFRILGIDFATPDIKAEFQQIWLFLVPLAFATLIFQKWKKKGLDASSIIAIMIFIVISFYIMKVLIFFSGFCVWNLSSPLYKNKNDKRIIQYRNFDCGATTDGKPYELVITEPIGDYLIHYTYIEKDEIDSLEWEKLEN